MAVKYAYTDTTGRKLTQAAYDAQTKAGKDVSGYKKIEAATVKPVATSANNINQQISGFSKNQGATTNAEGERTNIPTAQQVNDFNKQFTTTAPVVDMAKIKELPQYQELLGKGYTEEQISKAVAGYKPPETEKTAVVPETKTDTATQVATTAPTTTTTAKPEEIEATTVGKDQQALAPLPLSEYQDDSETRQSQIVNNLNAYRQSSPSYMKDLDTFRKTFSYGLRSDTQKGLLDNWYLGYQKGLELNGKNSSDLASLYSNGNISNSDLEQLRLQNPDKYAEVMALNDKKSTLSKYDAELNGQETATNPFQSIINNYASNMLSMSTAPSNMFAEYKAAMNSDDMKGMMSQLTDKEGEINQLDLQINQLKSDVERRYEGTGATRSKINAIIADETSALQELRNSKAIDYQTLAKKYENQMTSIKDEFDMQIKEQEYNNSQRNQQMQELGFMMELQNYETNEQKDEREWNNYIRQQEYQDGNIYSSDPATRKKAVEKAVDRVLTEFEGIPMLRSREQMVSDIQKMVDNGTELGEAITQNIRNPIMNKQEYSLWKKNKLGISSTPIEIGDNYYTQNADGSLSLWKGYSNGQASVGNLGGTTYTAVDPTTVQSAVQQISAQGDGSVGGQCGSFVNDYLQDLGLSRMFKDPITQKESLVNTQTPSVGSVVVMNSPVAKEYGHVGIVTSVNDDGTITIKNSNWNGDKKVTTNTLSKSSSQIVGYFDPTLGGSSSVIGGNNGTSTALTTILGSGKFTKDQKTSITNAIKNGEDPYTVIKNQAKGIMNSTVSTDVSNLEIARGEMINIQNLLNDYYEAGGDTSLFKGSYEKAINKLGAVKDPNLVGLAVNIASALQSYRNAVSGTAYSVKEGIEIENVFPGIKKSKGLNDAIIKARIQSFDTKIDSAYSSVLGENTYKSLKNTYGSNTTTTTTTSTTPTTKNYFTTYKTTTPKTYTNTVPSYFSYILGN